MDNPDLFGVDSDYTDRILRQDGLLPPLATDGEQYQTDRVIDQRAEAGLFPCESSLSQAEIARCIAASTNMSPPSS